jgi:hypothetical protein
MRSRTSLLVLAAFLFGGGAIAASIPIHAVWQTETATQLIWSQERLFLHVREANRGWAGSVAAWLWQMGRNFLGGSTQGLVSTHRSTVITIGSDGVREFPFQGPSSPVLVVYHATVYGQIGGELRRWNGSGFEELGADEAQRFQSAKLFTEPIYSDIGGWSSVVNMLMPPARSYRVALASGEVLVRTSLAESRRAVDVTRNGKVVWHAEWDSRPRYVGPSEYRRLLPQP